MNIRTNTLFSIAGSALIVLSHFCPMPTALGAGAPIKVESQDDVKEFPKYEKLWNEIFQIR